ncbi:MAG: porin family protein [Planctomycetes bacterium]|nr:porin family protein [Planctomycetota bacterium]
MKRKLFALTVMLIIACIASSDVFALITMGPPVSELNKGQYAAGIDYSYAKSNFRLVKGTSPGGGPSFTLEDVKTNFIYGKVGYGLTENIDIYIGAGGGSARGDDAANSTSIDFDGDNGFSYGIGAKVTLHEADDIKYGATFLLYNAETDGRMVAGGVRWSTDMDVTELQASVGAIKQINERCSIYGGPFIHQFDGDLNATDNTSRQISYDIRESDWFGGYVGSQINICENVFYNLEYQHTPSDNALAMSLLFKF